MSSAGWFPQPDGQERYYDGEDWTDQFRPGRPQGTPSAPPPKKSGVWKWVLIVVFIVLVLCCGGFAACSAGVIGAADEVSKSIEAEESESGGVNNAVTITEGEAFDVRGFNYAEGWKISEEYDMVEIEGLKVTNNRDERDGAIVEIKFMKGSEIAASVDCTSDQLQPGQTATLNCLSADALPDDYDKITINDSF